jgi:Fic family protein
MSKRALLLEAHHTTHIEGTHLTIEQAERLWAGQVVKEAQADDVRELLNYREAFHLVSDYLTSGEPVTEGLIREIHKRLVEGVRGGQGGPGAFRTVQNLVVNSQTREVIYTPPPPEDVPPMMKELAAWLRDESAVHPVLVAGIAQFQLVHIHPFFDGNGRTSRLLSTLCLYRSGPAARRGPPVTDCESRACRVSRQYRDTNRDILPTSLATSHDKPLWVSPRGMA